MDNEKWEQLVRDVLATMQKTKKPENPDSEKSEFLKAVEDAHATTLPPT